MGNRLCSFEHQQKTSKPEGHETNRFAVNVKPQWLNQTESVGEFWLSLFDILLSVAIILEEILEDP